MDFEVHMQFDLDDVEGIATPEPDDIHDWILNGCKALGIEPVLLVVNPA